MNSPGKQPLGRLKQSSSENGNPEIVSGDSSSRKVVRLARTSTRVSLFIESLVRSFISSFEMDSMKAEHTYNRICRNLHRMGFIDDSWSMVELEGVRIQFDDALLQLLSNTPLRSPSPLWTQNSYYSSHYMNEFEEFDKIGGGGFGKVFRVKHKLDGTEYAVKKIPIFSETLEKVKYYISEVKTLASLNHPNIVQYKRAWFELGPPQGKTWPKLTWHQPEVISPSTTDSQPILLREETHGSVRVSEKEDNSSFTVQFKRSVSKDSSDKTKNRYTSLLNSISDQGNLNNLSKVLLDDEASTSTITKTSGNTSNFEKIFNRTSETSVSSAKTSSSASSPIDRAIVPKHRRNGASSKRRKVCWATLYIQMAICHGTLHQWLRDRNERFHSGEMMIVNETDNLQTEIIREILIQILRGLAYIHSKKVVHHDIKPSNIFLSVEGRSLLVQLGDFGLACPFQQSGHEFARGTFLYSAPEQLRGHCDSKSDMYSVGIVLFELLERFNTEMERVERIKDLRDRADPPFPPDLNLGNLVDALVRKRASDRPDASTLLGVFQDGTRTCQSEICQRRMRELERENQRLKMLLEKHGINVDENN